MVGELSESESGSCQEAVKKKFISFPSSRKLVVFLEFSWFKFSMNNSEKIDGLKLGIACTSLHIVSIWNRNNRYRYIYLRGEWIMGLNWCCLQKVIPITFYYKTSYSVFLSSKINILFRLVMINCDKILTCNFSALVTMIKEHEMQNWWNPKFHSFQHLIHLAFWLLNCQKKADSPTPY